MIAAGLWWLTTRMRPAPDVTLTTLTGQQISLSQLHGQVVLLNFWSTDCLACLKERPLLTRIHNRFSSRGLSLIAVTMPYDPPNRVVSFVKLHPTSYPVALDPLGIISRAFDVTVVPTTVLIAKDGTLAWRYTGIPDIEPLQSFIENLISQGE